MKYTFLAFLFIISILTACKKDKTGLSVPDNHTEAKWTAYTTTNSQLTDNQVNALAIDKQDVKWVGTANGLVRINGNNWTVFDKNNSALPSLTIQALAVQDNGMVWIGTDNGLARYNGTTWINYTKANSNLPDNAIMSLHHDNRTGITWVGTASGLIKINPNNALEVYDEIAGDLILSMAADQNGAIWLGCFNPFNFVGTIRKLHNGQWQSYRLDLLGYPSAFPYGLGIDHNNSPVVMLSGTAVKTVIRLTGANWQELSHPRNTGGFRALLLEGNKIWVGGRTLTLFGDAASPDTNVPGLGDATIQAMALDSHGKKWLGTLNGLATYKD